MTEPDTRISELFSRVRQESRSGFIAYVTAGDPSLELTPKIVAALERGGVDLIELGVPFSDPIADGPVIQRASSRAIENGMTFAGVLRVAREIRERSQIPILLFTYMNPVLRYGLERAAKDAAGAGVDGFLLTDMSVEEAGNYVGAMRRYNLDTVFLAAPTSSERRRRLVAEYSRGFVYLVSRTGVTGEQVSVSESIKPLVQSMRAITELPLAVGFGIANSSQAREVAESADAVVVGSAIVRLIEENPGPQLETKLELFARDLAAGLARVPA